MEYFDLMNELAEIYDGLIYNSSDRKLFDDLTGCMDKLLFGRDVKDCVKIGLKNGLVLNKSDIGSILFNDRSIVRFYFTVITENMTYVFYRAYGERPYVVDEDFVRKKIDSEGVQILGVSKYTPEWIEKIAKDEKWIIT